jgi:hypothetical protein
MPRRKKPPIEWTTEEAMRKLFHPSVVKKAREEIESLEKPRKRIGKPPTEGDST